jgi:hypothetical protein
VHTHNARQSIAIRDTDGGEAQCLCRQHQLVCMGAATQKTEIRHDGKLGETALAGKADHFS